jgi:hypothetical protein
MHREGASPHRIGATEPNPETGYGNALQAHQKIR